MRPFGSYCSEDIFGLTYNVRPPKYLSWFITPITIVIGVINHSSILHKIQKLSIFSDSPDSPGDLKDVAACRAACVRPSELLLSQRPPGSGPGNVMMSEVQTLACQHFSFTEKQVVSMTKVQKVQQAQAAEQAKQEAAEAAEAAEKETKEEKAEKVQDESDELRAEQKKLFGQLKEKFVVLYLSNSIFI